MGHLWVLTCLLLAAATVQTQTLFKNPNFDPSQIFQGQAEDRSFSRRVTDEEAIVETTHGTIRGFVTQTTRKFNRFAAYLGVPFAEPPVGDLRFKAPVPHAPWTGILNTTREQASCIGKNSYNYIITKTDEDCLHLNLFTPAIPGEEVTELKAIMIFMYGGGWGYGSDKSFAYAPDTFIDNDVIYAAMNYRLSFFGFLSLQNEEVPGNAGLKDQGLAIKWIHANAERFGGDPNRITIFGESAGAASTSYLMLAKPMAGYFNGAIMESGTAMHRWAFTDPETAMEYTFTFADNLECGVDRNDPNVKDLLLACFRNRTAQEISDAHSGIETQQDIDDLKIEDLGPCMEPDVEGAFITRSPIDIVTSGDYNKVACILGENSREALMIWNDLIEDETGDELLEMGRNLTKILPPDLKYGLSVEMLNEMDRILRDYYFDGGQLTIDKRLDVVDMGTTTHFSLDKARLTLLLAERQTEPVYSYHFSYSGPFNILKIGYNIMDIEGAAHADELGYLFAMVPLEWIYDFWENNTIVMNQIERLPRYWANFAKYGTPTPVIDDLTPAIWHPFTKDQHYYIDLRDEPVVSIGLKAEEMRLWNDLYDMGKGIRPYPEEPLP